MATPVRPRAGGLVGGFFNVSIYGNDALHRGNAYMGFSSSGGVDFATGARFDLELLPRITGPNDGSRWNRGGALPPTSPEPSSRLDDDLPPPTPDPLIGSPPLCSLCRY